MFLLLSVLEILFKKTGGLLMLDPWSYFLFQPVFHNWFSEGRDMYYPLCRLVEIKDSLSMKWWQWISSLAKLSFTICLTPYNLK